MGMIYMDDPRVLEILRKKCDREKFPKIEKREILDEIEKKWTDRRCFIIGGGPSLKGFDFSKLENEFVIGINRAFEVCRCDIIFSMDRRFFQWVLNIAGNHDNYGIEAEKKFLNSKAYKIRLATEEAPELKEKNIIDILCLGRDGISFNLKEGLYHGNNSGYAALNLAITLGCNPIYLLGYDMNPEGGWWHTGHPGGQGSLDGFTDSFKSNINQIAKKSIVINLNPESYLDVFKKESIDDLDIFKKKKAKRLIFDGCLGFGDNFYQRPLLKHILKSNKYEKIYIKTAFPEAYWDFDPSKIEIIKPDNCNLRTQKLHISEYKKWGNLEIKNYNDYDFLNWIDALPGYLPIEQNGNRPQRLSGDISNTGFLEKRNNIQDFDFTFPLKKEWIEDARNFLKNLGIKKKICIIRQPTIRLEWDCRSRNPKIEYFQRLIDKYKDEYFYISISNNESNKEWFDGELSGIDARFDNGQIPITTILGILKLSDMIITYPGFFMLASIAVKAKCFCIFGGMQAPELLLDENMGLQNFEFIAPDSFCSCMSMKHACNKKINESRLISKFADFMAKEKWEKKITIGIPAGIGDIHWIFTKLESFKEKNAIDKLGIKIFQDQGHTNSIDFIRLIPFIDFLDEAAFPIKFDFSCHGGKGNPIEKQDPTIRGLDYLIEFNSPLENGYNLVDILPEYKINYDYEIKYPEKSKEFALNIKEKAGKKLCLIYTSSEGANANWAKNSWKKEDWKRIIELMFKETGSKIVILGKSWDLDYVEALKKNLNENQIIDLTDKTTITETIALIRESDIFVGFPSGLTVLAAHFQKKVIMFWPPDQKRFGKMMTSWLPQKTLKLGNYIPIAFGSQNCRVDYIENEIRRLL